MFHMFIPLCVVWPFVQVAGGTDQLGAEGTVSWDGVSDQRVIAKGGQGSVSTCTWNGVLVAVKMVDAVHAATLMRERDALQSLLHPNIVQVHSCSWVAGCRHCS